jgi:LuxR family transcriptional regulator, quorum-sensing system regulator SolR
LPKKIIVMQASLANWWDDVVTEMSAAPTEESVFAVVGRLSGRLGFVYSSYGLKAPSNQSRPQVRMYDSYPRQWSERYRDRDYVSIDPTVKVGRATGALVVWSDHLFSPAPLLWREARDSGLRTGLSQPSWVSKGTFALLSVARDSRPISESEVAALRPYLMLMTEAASVAISRISSNSAEGHGPLTRREIEVLRWSADGKTAYETSVLLGVAEATVNFHVQNALRKLGVVSKIQAVALTVSSGLLE